MNRCTVYAPAAKPNDIQPGKACTIADYAAERNDVSLNSRDSSNHCATSNPDELMQSGRAPDNRSVADINVATHNDVVGYNDIVSDVAVMCDMNNRH